MGAQGEEPQGQGCDGRAGVRPGALAAQGERGSCCSPPGAAGEAGAPASSAGPSRWLQSIWVAQLPLYPLHMPASRRPADTLSLIYGHRFVVHSWCLRDSADFTLA